MDFHKLPGSQSAIGSVFRVRANRAGSEFIVIERNKNLRGAKPVFLTLRAQLGPAPARWELAPPGGSRKAGSPAPLPALAFSSVLPGRLPLSRDPAVRSPSLGALRCASPLRLPPAPARPHPAPRAGLRSNSRQASGPRHPARAFPVRRRAGGASTMVGTVTSQGGALGERGRLGRLGAGWASLWRLCSSVLALGPRFSLHYWFLTSSSLRRDLEANGIFYPL